MRATFLVLIFIISSCAMVSRETDQLLKNNNTLLPKKVKLTQVPFIKQEKYHCGPATMAMVFKAKGVPFEMANLTSQMYTKSLQGTYQSEMLSVVRRHRLVALPLHSLTQMLEEVSDGHPVIAFQNLGLESFPVWHYSLLTGHDLDGPDVFMHSGEKKHFRMDMRHFERTWELGGKWAILILSPSELSKSSDELTHVRAASMLEELSYLDEARLSYEAILSRWPRSLGALVGLGNVYYKRNDLKKSINNLKKAATYHSNSAFVWHNLAMAEGAAGDRARARKSSMRALKLAPPDQTEKLTKSLREWLKD